MTSLMIQLHHRALRDWARGSYPLEAATELLIRTQDGRFASDVQPWVHVEGNGRTWISYDELVDHLAAGGQWSGGERRILALAAALGADDGLLNDVLPGLDRGNVALVLAAVSHAAGSHEHGPDPFIWGMDAAGEPRPIRNPDRSKPGPLYPWPAADGPKEVS